MSKGHKKRYSDEFGICKEECYRVFDKSFYHLGTQECRGKDFHNCVGETDDKDSNDSVFDGTISAAGFSTKDIRGVEVSSVDNHRCTDDESNLRNEFYEVDKVLEDGISGHNSGGDRLSQSVRGFFVFIGFFVVVVPNMAGSSSDFFYVCSEISGIFYFW
jgi:hypothetical protein